MTEATKLHADSSPLENRVLEKVRDAIDYARELRLTYSQTAGLMHLAKQTQPDGKLFWPVEHAEVMQPVMALLQEASDFAVELGVDRISWCGLLCCLETELIIYQ